MRQFAILERIQGAEFSLLEKKYGATLSDDFKNYLKTYAGMSILECNYRDKSDNHFQVGQFLMFDEINALSKDFLEGYKRKLIPFAFDPGGWHFCLCFDEIDYGAIIVNRWTDHTPDEQFLKIADSFEEFIDGLKREDEV